MRDRYPKLLAVAAAAALAVAGCGDDDETTTTETGGVALTEEQFVEQANEICAAGDKEIDRAADDLYGDQQPSQEQIDQFAAEILVPGIQGQIDAIRALAAPEELAAEVETFLDDAQSALDEVEADPSLLEASDEEGPFADVNRQGEELGLTECAG